MLQDQGVYGVGFADYFLNSTYLRSGGPTTHVLGVVPGALRMER